MKNPWEYLKNSAPATKSTTDTKPTLDINSLLNANETERVEIQKNYEIELANYMHHKNNQNKHRFNFKSNTVSKILIMLKILVCLIVVGIVSWLCVYTYQCNNYLNSLNTNITEAYNTISSLKEDVSKLNSKIFDLNMSVTELQEDYKSIKDDTYSDVSGNDLNLSPKVVTPFNNTYNMQNNLSNKRLCAVPDCNNETKTGSYYCYRHECMDVGCHEKIVNDFCHYCVLHKCIVQNCNNGVANNSYYCTIHNH